MKKKVTKPTHGLGMDKSKLNEAELRAWEECNWCYANSCWMCGYRDIAIKYGWT